MSKSFDVGIYGRSCGGSVPVGGGGIRITVARACFQDFFLGFRKAGGFVFMDVIECVVVLVIQKSGKVYPIRRAPVVLGEARNSEALCKNKGTGEGNRTEASASSTSRLCLINKHAAPPHLSSSPGVSRVEGCLASMA